MFNPQPPHHQPQWPQTFNQPSQRRGPPPSKKVKNNPVITRYPPPPGYRGPAQPHFQSVQHPQTWSHPPQPPSSGQQSYFGHPDQSYGGAKPQQLTQYPAFQPNHYSQAQYYQNAPATSGYYQPYSDPNSYPHAAPDWTYSASASPWTEDPYATHQRRHSSAPSLSFTTNKFGYPSGDDIAPSQPGTDEVLEEDFYDECYFATHPEEIDPNFSLGMIEWKAPLPTRRPLPSTFAEAELEVIAPRKPLPSNDDSISEYFVKARRHEALLSVRQTDYWHEIKDDVVFKEFPALPPASTLLSMSELLAKYKSRPDPTWSARVYSPTPDPESGSEAYGETMEVEGAADHAYEHTDMLGSLQQTVQERGAGHKRRHSRASSTASISSQRAKRHKPLMPIRDEAQEDVLAALGVTGSPQIVYQTPGPAIGAPQPQQQISAPSHDRWPETSTGANRAPQGSYQLSRQQYNQRSYSDNNYGRRGSNASSHHTAMGSDFEDNDATPRAKYHPKDSRKRGYESSGDDRYGRSRRYDDDETPKARRVKHQRVDDPYRARRW